MMKPILTAILLAASASQAYATEKLSESLEEYFDFAPATAGVILPAQISPDLFKSFLFIDTRPAAAFAEGHIEGAKNMEWREVLARHDEIPTDKPVILYCNTGVFSAQATFAIRVMGWENVVVLQRGYLGWLEHQQDK